jgi:hypothetical protein
MWRRLRRKTFAPSRPAVYPEQVALLVVTLAAIGVGAWFLVRVAFG